MVNFVYEFQKRYRSVIVIDNLDHISENICKKSIEGISVYQ